MIGAPGVMNDVAPPWQSGTDLSRPIGAQARGLADDIFARIAAGEFIYGARLPSERSVSESYALSRTTVRQALGLLERHGVIVRRHGSGSVVRYTLAPDPQPAAPDPQPAAPEASIDLADLANITSPLEYSVARSIVEPEIVRLAVLNMTSRDMHRLAELLGELEVISTDGAAFAEADGRLRRHLAQSARNPLLMAMWRLIEHVEASADWALARHAALPPGRIREQRARVRALAAAIKARDLGAAIEHVKLTLTDLHHDLLRSG